MNRRQFLVGGIGLAALGSFTWRSGRKTARVNRFQLAAFGTTINILTREDESPTAVRGVRLGIAKFIAKTHQQFTLFQPSPLTAFNDHPPEKALQVQPELITLTKLGMRYAVATNHRYDPTLGVIMKRVRQGDQLNASHWDGMGIDKIRIDGDRIARLHPKTALDFNALVKGWAVDEICDLMKKRGLQNFLVNAGGDIRAVGTQGDVEGWRVDIAGPNSTALHTLTLSNEAIATSGNSKQAYQHLISPQQHRASSELFSASVVAKTAAEADAWSTAAFVGGLDWSTENKNGHQILIADKHLSLHEA